MSGASVFLRSCPVALALAEGQIDKLWLSMFLHGVCPLSASSLTTGNRLSLHSVSEPQEDKGTNVHHLHTCRRHWCESNSSSVRFSLGKRWVWCLNSATGDLVSQLATMGETNLSACGGLNDTSAGIWRFMHYLKGFGDATEWTSGASVSAQCRRKTI